MALIDEEFMEEVGLGGMSDVEKRAFMEQAREELEVRVGRQISNRLTPMQLSEFMNIGGAREIADWLEANVPDFREVTAQVFQNFKNEISEQRQAILG